LQLETWIAELQRAFNVVVGAPVPRTTSRDQSSLDHRGGVAPALHPFRCDLRLYKADWAKPHRHVG
jgi:hypothetical protein